MGVFGGKHDVGRFEVAVNDVVAMKFLRPLQYLVENFLNCELFLAGNYLIEISCEPLHDHHGLFLADEGLHHLYQMLAVQNLEDVPLPHEADGQAHLIQCLKLFYSHDLLGEVVARLVDNAVGTLLDLLQDGVLVLEGGKLHSLRN
jgi:hypothetical protein